MPSSPAPQTRPQPLGQLMISQGLITSEGLASALEHRRQSGLRLGAALVELGLATPHQVSKALYAQGKLTCIRLNPKLVNLEVARELGQKFSRKHRAIAINRIAGVATVAMDDPADVYALDALARQLDSKIFATYSEASQIDECIRHVFEVDKPKQTNKQAATDTEAKPEHSNVTSLYLGCDKPKESDDSDELAGPVVSILQAILKEALHARATDIHLEPRLDKFVVRFRIDGTLQDRMTLKQVWARPCVARAKIIGHLDPKQRQLPQNGRAQILIDGRRVDLRVASMPTLLGESAVIQIQEGRHSMHDMASFDLRSDQERRMRCMLRGAAGLVLAVGPTGCGKTSTLYAMLQELSRPDGKIITLEDPVENEIETISQIHCDSRIGMTFSKGLRAALHQDPDVILVGKLDDLETVSLSVQAALNGHLVLSTMHTIGTLETITRMCEMGIEHYLLSDTLRGIVAQRLVRLICPSCKVEDEIDDTLRKTMGLGPDEIFYRGEGCIDCSQTGYRGRRGLYEIMLLNPAFRDALRAGADAASLRKLAIAEGMLTLRQEGLHYARAGATTITEVLAMTPRTCD